MSKDLTITEKIFTRTAGKPAVAGDFVMASIDRAMTHDITGPLAVEAFNEIMKDEKDKTVWDPDRIIILFDHQVPADSLNAANNHILLRKFAKEQGIKHFYDLYEGVCHQVMPEKGHVLPGDLIIGSDSHTCAYGALGAFATGVGSTDMGAALALGKLWFRVPETIRFEVDGKLGDCVYSKDIILKLIGDVGADGARYKACEYAGEAIHDLDISQRMTVSNMAIEMGGKAGIVMPDERTEKYLRQRVPGFKLDKNLTSDEGAKYSAVKKYDVSDMPPQVACPHNVDNVVDIDKVEGKHIDQVFLGSCTNGRFEDLKIAADLMGDKPVAKGVRMIIIPASRTEYMKTLKAGLVDQFMTAGAMVESPCCGPCMGGSFGLLGPGEVGLSTSNRNFRGRQGSADAFVYLCSPATAAASALKGKITDPRSV
jgi:3-isopropylmalate/(R)-2-methylmalate dehydratase large subunit